MVREAARRTLNMRHFDVQILGGIAMFHRSIVEMQTGEGKTLTATLPMYLHGLMGQGCHLATVNDYFARRDADWMAPVYRALGLSVGVIETPMAQPERRKAYACDVTYGTAKEFGFDFLRDRLLLRRIGEGQTDLLGGMLGRGKPAGDEKPVQRDPYFALVDEADSILIDEARTPLIISALPTEEEKLAVECYQWSAGVIHEFVEDEDYEYDHEKKTAELTREGRLKVRCIVQAGGPWTRSAWSTSTSTSSGRSWSIANIITIGNTSSAKAKSSSSTSSPAGSPRAASGATASIRPSRPSRASR